MAKDPELRLNAGDVSVVKSERRRCSQCDKQLAVTYAVLIDFRSAGTAQQIDDGFCHSCAQTLASRIREGLPNARD